MSIQKKQEEIIEEFALLGDGGDAQSSWMAKYEYIIELGRDLPIIDPAFKTDENLIKGCQSKVWLHAERRADGSIHYTADSDAIITKGLVALVVRVLGDEMPEDICAADLHFIREIGLNEHLSQTRSNGLASMIKQMKIYALGFSAQTASQE